MYKSKGDMNMNYNKEELIKSPLNYTGGKFKLLPQILPLFPDNIRMFVDMFCGGCNVGLNVNAEKIICNDYMYQIIELYSAIRNNTNQETFKHIEERISSFDLSMENKDGYLKLRELYNKERNPLDLFVLTCYSFNYSIRFNSNGDFNIAFGKDRSYFNQSIKERLSVFMDRSKKITFTNFSFEDLKVEKLTNEDFVYADPPYLITVANYNENGGWNKDMEIKLLEKLDLCNENGVRFALSNVLEHKGKSNDILKEWSKKYNINYLNYDYSNCNYQTKDKTKKSSVEVLITNY